jgi:protein-tyrosine phosphatase
MKILMVCLGNICRSPMAEGILRAKVEQRGLDWLVDSAGTESYHVNQPPHPFAIRTAARQGVDISALRARKFIPEDFFMFDRIYAMATDVYGEIQEIGGSAAPMDKVRLFLDELYPGRVRSVPDPYYGPEKGFREVYDLLEMGCEQILTSYAVSASPNFVTKSQDKP